MKSNAVRNPFFFIVTPTYDRAEILKEFLKGLSAQSYVNWKAIVIHDGPDRDFCRDYQADPYPDSRVDFRNTAAHTADFGMTPRRVALNEIARTSLPFEYCLLWDDDNHFQPEALSTIAKKISETGFPDLLLVPFRCRGRVLPPENKGVGDLGLGELDSGCLAIRATCLEGLHDVGDGLALPETYRHDFEIFQRMRMLNRAIVVAQGMAPVGQYDGLRGYHRWVSRSRWAQRVFYWLSWRRLSNSLAAVVLRLKRGEGLLRARVE